MLSDKQIEEAREDLLREREAYKTLELTKSECSLIVDALRNYAEVITDRIKEDLYLKDLPDAKRETEIISDIIHVYEEVLHQHS